MFFCHFLPKQNLKKTFKNPCKSCIFCVLSNCSWDKVGCLPHKVGQIEVQGVKMAGLIGEYNHTIDAKGRLSVPSKFRTVLGDSFVISKGFDGCLVIYSDDEWNDFSDKLNSLPSFDPQARQIKRFFGSGASRVDIDSHGRILVPAPLLEYAGLTRDVTIVGTADGRAEVWDTSRWNSENGNVSPEDAAKNLFERGIVI